MTSPDQQLLLDYGLDYDHALARFAGNEELYHSFLRELPQDECMPNILAAREKRDHEGYLMAVHALKGLSGTLSLQLLFSACVNLMNALRANDEQAAEALFPALQAEFEQALELSKHF